MTSARRLRIWCDSSVSPDWDLVALVQPVAVELDRCTPYQRSVLGPWWERGPELLELTEPEDCDVAVLPFGLEAIGEHPELWSRAVELAHTAQRHGRLMLVFCHGDRYIPAPADNCIMLRTSLHRSRVSPRDVPLPAWVRDPEDVVPSSTRAFAPVPSVGFIGQAYPLGLQGRGPLHRALKWLKWSVRSAVTAVELDDLLRVPPDGGARVASLLALRRSRHVHAHLVIRGAMTRLDLDAEDDQPRHLEFLEGLRDNDYGLAVSGLGNYSYRLYETLAAGRPAVVVDTDLLLPGADRLAWDRITITVPVRGVPRLGRLIAEEHRRRGAAGFAEAQQLSRETWVSELSADGFLRRLVAVVAEALGRPDASSVTAAELAGRLR